MKKTFINEYVGQVDTRHMEKLRVDCDKLGRVKFGKARFAKENVDIR